MPLGGAGSFRFVHSADAYFAGPFPSYADRKQPAAVFHIVLITTSKDGDGPLFVLSICLET